jgi:hypothetical protein
VLLSAFIFVIDQKRSGRTNLLEAAMFHPFGMVNLRDVIPNTQFRERLGLRRRANLRDAC